jgi:hypothetical protein
VFGVGIGSRDWGINCHIIEGLSYAGAGEAYFITNQTEAETTGKKLVNDISLPVWTHISIDWRNMEVFDTEPSSAPDLYEAKPLVVFGKYQGKAKGVIKISGQTGLGTSEQDVDASNAVESDSQALRYLWARNRIKYLSDYAHYFEDGVRVYYRSEERTEYEKEITGLGLKYNLLTKYTSLIAVDDENYTRRSVEKEMAFHVVCCKRNLNFGSLEDLFIYEKENLRMEELIKEYLTENVGFINDNIQLPDDFHFDTIFKLNRDGSISKKDIEITALITVDANGKIINVLVQNCPDIAFETELKKALMKITIPKVNERTEMQIRITVSDGGEIKNININ